MWGITETLQLVCIAGTIGFCVALYWGLRRKNIRREPGDKKISVLIAARNEAEGLASCLQSLADQDYPEELSEFIIIDDDSNDATAAIAQEWVKKDNRFFLLHLDNDAQRLVGPKKRALLAGLKISSGEIIFTTDADCLTPRNWISGMISCFGEKTTAVCGLIRFKQTDGFWGNLAAFEGLINAILNAAVIGAGGALSCFGANLVYRRADFFAVGGYDRGSKSLSGDDDLLLQRFHRGGKKLCFCCDPQLAVETRGPIGCGAYLARKRRHLSAGRKYEIHWIALAAMIYIGSFLTVLLAVVKLSGVYSGYLFLIGWALLSAALLLVFIKGSKRLEASGYFAWALVAALFFPLIFSLIHPLSLLPAPSWRGRKN
ncbi:MAG: glycosyltransferase [bacterium]|nr:glycosyltransferase [bacterium]